MDGSAMLTGSAVSRSRSYHGQVDKIGDMSLYNLGNYKLLLHRRELLYASGLQ